MKKTIFRAGSVAVVLAVLAYWYWSPLLAMYQMRSAARAGDVDTFNTHVDYPRLRENFKAQLSALLDKKLDRDSAGSDVGRAGRAFGKMLGLTVGNTLVDTLVRPQTVMRALQQGKVVPKTGTGNPPDTPAAQQSSDRDASEQVSWTSERKGSDKYIAYFKQAGSSDDKRVAVVLERSGFASWKLTEIRLPSLMQ